MTMDASREYVTLHVADQLFGVAVTDIHDVFALGALTPVPLAPREVAGVLNLRGRIVTAVDARARLGLPARAGGCKGAMALGIEKGGDSYGLVVDSVGEVVRLGPDTWEANPTNLDARWRDVARGAHRLDDGLMVVLDIARMLEIDAPASAAA